MPCLSPAGDDKNPAPIEFPKSVVSGKDVVLESALRRPPEMTRDIEIEAPRRVVKYFLSRPHLAYRILDDSGASPIRLERSEDGDEWEMTGGSGSLYTLKTLRSGEDHFAIRFGFFYRAPIGIGIKLSGAGAFVGRIRTKTGSSESVFLDYDIYFSPGSLPLDKITEYLPLQRMWIAGDFKSAARAFAELCESAVDDPETMVDDMEFSEDVFTPGEIREFRLVFGLKKR